jgi:proline utilization trans-activator
MVHADILTETFLPWDLDSLFVSTMIFLLAGFVDSSLLNTQSPWLSKAFAFLDIIVDSGNRIAGFRLRELRKLEGMLAEYSVLQTQLPYTPTASHNDTCPPPNQDLVQPYAVLNDESSGFGDDLTAEQILAVADSMELEGTDWLSTATVEPVSYDSLA